jgi:ankyrin repeat protein
MTMKFLASLTAVLLLKMTTAFAGPLHDAARQGDIATIEALIASGTDVNEVQMVTPLTMAALSGQQEAVERLLALGADPDIESSAMGTALHAAAQRGFADVVRILLTGGANPESRNPDNYTPLMIAALNNRLDALTTLIEAGADVNAVGVARSNGMGGNGKVNALHVASFNGDTDSARILRENGAVSLPIDLPADALAGADVELGKELTHQWCRGCHVVADGGSLTDKPQNGPPLQGVFGRRIASVPGFGYTEALQRVEGEWTAELLYSYAAEAMLTVPGTRMRWNDGWTEDDVRHIVAYFASEADK